MPICEGCASSYDDSFKFCPNCGRVKPEGKKITIAVEVNDKKHDFDCPLCDDARSIQKVSAIVSGGTTIGHGSTSTSGTSTLYSGQTGQQIGNQTSSSTSSTYHKSQTVLSEKLTLYSEPYEPKAHSYEVSDKWAGIFGVVFYVIGIGITWPLGEILDFDSFWSGAVVFFCSAPIVTVVGTILIMKLLNRMNNSSGKYKAAMEVYKRKHAFYVKVKAQWDELYYCHNHDIVYTLSRKEPVSVDHAIEACEKWAGRG